MAFTGHPNPGEGAVPPKGGGRRLRVRARARTPAAGRLVTLERRRGDDRPQSGQTRRAAGSLVMRREV